MIRTAQTDPFIPTDGIHNLRDYGGFGAADGGQVRSGLLFRSGQHIEASEPDLAAIKALDLRTVIDLRGTSERTRFPCRRPDGFAADVLAYDGETSNSPPHEGGSAPAEMTAEKARERMLAVYTRMPVNPAMVDMFSRYFAALTEREGASLVHCFAGKDRTGVAVSLLLYVLGVHHDDIMAEFLRTNDAPTRQVLERQSLPRMEQHYGTIEPQALDNLMGVREEYLATYWAEVTRQAGSIDAYLAQTLGVDDTSKARLRERFIG
ncbi:MAG: tyrosine-protein phosphatase [Pseudomonadota bacterium]